ncbi:MAG: DNA polymerase III subunit delta [Chloroflexi bacterium]|nr:DNA polymerase III subunit delta [Chloroflexota bacterium]
MIYIFYGEDTYSLKQAVDKLKEGLGDMATANTTLLNGRHLSLNELRAVCNVMPFLASQRLIIVEGLLSLYEPRPADRPRAAVPKGDEAWFKLAEYSPQMPPPTILALLDGKLGGKNPLLQALASAATVREFRPLGQRDIGVWIRTQVTAKGGTISPAAVSLLASLVGNNLWLLSHEIEKLILYASPRAIEAEDVNQTVSLAKETKIFDLVDFIVEGKASPALQSLYRSLEEGMTPPYILVMLTRQFRLLLRAKELASLSQAQVKEKLGGGPPYPLQKALMQAPRYSRESLDAAYRRLLEADLFIKTGKGSGETALMLLVADLCSMGP